MTVEGKLQPLPVLLSGEIQPLILELLAAGERKASAYVDRAPCALVPFETLYPDHPAEEAFLNVNDPASLEQARRILGVPQPR
jgi:molybdopterin-guanine dinucleotide biosynthesis protein A